MLSNLNKNILILTYTINNIMEIRKKLYAKQGFIPQNVTIQTWFSFLLNDIVHPYQNSLINQKRISLIKYTNELSAKGIKKENIKKYFLDDEGAIYSDKMAEFGFEGL